MQFYEQTLDMRLDRLLPDPQFAGDLLVAETFRDQLENLDLARRQAALAATRGQPVGDLRRNRPLTCDDPANGGDRL